MDELAFGRRGAGSRAGSTGFGGPRGLGLWLAAALIFFAPGLARQTTHSGQSGLPELTLRAAQAQDFAAAGQHFSSAQDAFAQGKYEQAAKEFQAAFDITHDPSMLVNIGESWQRAGDGKKALVGYRAYLAAQPQAPDKSEIEGRIQALEAALAEAAAGTGAAGATSPATTASAPPATGANPTPSGLPAGAEQPPTVPPVVGQGGPVAGPGPGSDKTNLPSDAAKLDAARADAAKVDTSSKTGVTTPTSPSTGLRTAAWVSVAVAVALATSGAIVGLGAQDRADELRRRTTLLVGNQPPVYDAGQAEAYTTLQSEGRAYNQAGIALLSAAGAVAVTAGILFIVDYVRRPKAETRSKGSWALVPTLLPGTGGGQRTPAAGGFAAGGSF